ncbi:MAG: SLC13 family permease [Bacillota bacterium]|nr:SLC13 family permease [Bacillota bacterium]
MKLAAILLFIAMYAVMIIKPNIRMYAALAVAIIYCLLGIVSTAEIGPAIDFNVIFMIVGTMVVVDYFIDSKMPNRLSEILLGKSKNVRMAIILMSLFAGIVSAFIDNVATVLMIAPVGMAICRKLDINPTGMILAIAVSSNLQGAATLVGDTTSIMLGTYAKMDFTDFFFMQGKPGIFFAVELGALATILVMRIIFKNQNEPVSGGAYVEIESSWPSVMLIGIVVALIAASFIPNKPSMTNGLICVSFALISMLIDFAKNKKIRKIWKKLLNVDTETIILLASMFVVIRGVQNVELIKDASEFIGSLGQGNIFILYTAIVWISVLVSAFVDNIPYVATMLPVVQEISLSLGISPYLLYFGLLSGATLGGNITPVGASANITATGILRQAGYDVKFKDFAKIGIPFTLTAVIVGYVFLWIVWR